MKGAPGSGVGPNGIPGAALMSGAHWRKPWPEGAVDDDVEFEGKIIDRFNHPLPPPLAPPVHEHKWVEFEPHTTT